MPKVIVLKEHGTNCERESAYAFQVAGADVDIVHMNELIKKPSQLQNYQILMLPGGFSHGDHTGSGKRWTNRLNHHLGDALRENSVRPQSKGRSPGGMSDRVRAKVIGPDGETKQEIDTGGN